MENRCQSVTICFDCTREWFGGERQTFSLQPYRPSVLTYARAIASENADLRISVYDTPLHRLSASPLGSWVSWRWSEAKQVNVSERGRDMADRIGMAVAGLGLAIFVGMIVLMLGA